MKWFFPACLSTVFTFSGVALAGYLPPGENTYQPVSFQPCSQENWHYYSPSQGYVCFFPDRPVQMYTADQVDAMVGHLTQRLQQLEERLNAVEGAHSGNGRPF